MDKRKVTVVLFPSVDGGYVAHIPLFPSCTTQGDTPEEAFRNAQESLELALEAPGPDDLECLEYSHPGHVVIGEVEVAVRVSERVPSAAIMR